MIISWEKFYTTKIWQALYEYECILIRECHKYSSTDVYKYKYSSTKIISPAYRSKLRWIRHESKRYFAAGHERLGAWRRTRSPWERPSWRRRTGASRGRWSPPTSSWPSRGSRWTSSGRSWPSTRSSSRDEEAGWIWEDFKTIWEDLRLCEDQYAPMFCVPHLCCTKKTTTALPCIFLLVQYVEHCHFYFDNRWTQNKYILSRFLVLFYKGFKFKLGRHWAGGSLHCGFPQLLGRLGCGN